MLRITYETQAIKYFKKTKDKQLKKKFEEAIIEIRNDPSVGDLKTGELNPLFFNSKKYISADLYFLFQQSLDCYLPKWAIDKYHEIGNLRKEQEVKEIK